MLPSAATTGLFCSTKSWAMSHSTSTGSTLLLLGFNQIAVLGRELGGNAGKPGAPVLEGGLTGEVGAVGKVGSWGFLTGNIDTGGFTELPEEEPVEELEVEEVGSEFGGKGTVFGRENEGGTREESPFGGEAGAVCPVTNWFVTKKSARKRGAIFFSMMES